MPANTEHPAVAPYQPTDQEMPIWRYLSLAKLISLLQTRCLPFAKLEVLADDPYEGTLPPLNQIAAELSVSNINFKQDFVQCVTDFMRGTTFVNCWCGNQKESAAMWGIYGSIPGSVAVQTTYGKLVSTLPEDHFVGLVRYIDYDGMHDSFPGGNVLYSCIHKRIEFGFEREIRAFKWDADKEIDGNGPPVLMVPVDLDHLIDRIFVKSTEDSWMVDVITGLLDCYNLRKEVARSSIDRDPIRVSLPPPRSLSGLRHRGAEGGLGRSQVRVANSCRSPCHRQSM